jgi:hypothetical protein
MKLVKEWYQVKVSGSETGVKFQFLKGDGLGLSKEFRKLYVVLADMKGDEECWYVGEAHTDIKTRFQRSFNAYRYYKRHMKKVQGGSIGYKWIEPASKLEFIKVLVVTFPESGLIRKTVEAIEGQLVFMVRNYTGQWPLWQNEIHFWNECEDYETRGTKAVAEEIFNEIFMKKHN